MTRYQRPRPQRKHASKNAERCNTCGYRWSSPTARPTVIAALRNGLTIDQVPHLSAEDRAHARRCRLDATELPRGFNALDRMMRQRPNTGVAA